MGAYASVAQLDRASDSDSEGRGFESRQMHQNKTCRSSKTDLHVFYTNSRSFYRQNRQIEQVQSRKATADRLPPDKGA